MTERPPAIRCLAVSKRYGDVDALRDFSLEAPAHGVLGLLGPSGSGKTTALRVIAGFERPDTGTVEIAGRTVVDDRRMTPPERRRVGMVFQHYALFPHMSVARNIAYGLDDEEDRAARVAEVLEMVGLSGAQDRMPHELSGGEQQRIALARALAPRPDVVLLDEPFSNLDARRRDAVRREVRSILVEARAAAVFVTHDQEEALAMSDVVAVMRDGSVIQTADPSELYHRPTDCWVARFLGEAEFVDGTAGGGVVDTPLGRFPVDDDMAGSVEVMIRPESVRVIPAEKGTALVVEREFYGHDQLITLHLDDGRRLLSRMGPAPNFRPGDRVDLLVRDVVAFPASEHEH
jgi:iron(III) transport system ATP-binding protein